MAKDNRLILHSTVAWSFPLLADIAVAKLAGFDGIDPSVRKLQGFLDAGYSEIELSAALRDVDIPGFGVIYDIERQGEKRSALMAHAHEVMHLATISGAKGIQAIPGPMDVRATIAHVRGEPTDLYTGVLGLPRTEQMDIMCANLVEICDMARERNLIIYLEPMSWTPLNRLTDNVEIIERVARDNLKLCVDFWHCFTSGDRPEDVAKLPVEMLYGVHVCDSLPFDGGVPDEVQLRNLRLGAGVIDLKEWTEAVKSTGYKDWWSCEIMDLRQHQRNGFDVAAECHRMLHGLVHGTTV